MKVYDAIVRETEGFVVCGGAKVKNLGLILLGGSGGLSK